MTAIVLLADWSGARDHRRLVAALLAREETQQDGFYKELNMLWTIFVILLIMWALGLATSYTLGGFVHILLVIALVMLVINLIQGRRI
jgi:hypothetical protein